MEFSISKTIIFGNSGSGKSTLAMHLCDKYAVAHLDLDTLAWQATEPPSRRPLAESRSAIINFIDSNKSWVIEGCYTDLLDFVSEFATELVYMDLAIELCVENARRRPWEPHKYESQQAQDANLDMLINWIQLYDQRGDTFSAASHREFYHSFAGKKRKITCNEDLS